MDIYGYWILMDIISNLNVYTILYGSLSNNGVNSTLKEGFIC